MSSPTAESGQSRIEYDMPMPVRSGDLTPIDFYWWATEQAHDNSGAGIVGIDSVSDATRFMAGGQQELCEAQNGDGQEESHPTFRRVSKLAIKNLGLHLDNSEISETEKAQKLNHWEIAGGLLVGAEKLTEAIDSIQQTDEHLRQLRESVRQRTLERFSLTPEDSEELELMANGVTAKERAGKLGVETHKISNIRHSILSRLKASSQAHGIRIALEEGIIDLSDGIKEEPSTDLSEDDIEILDLYSRGYRPSKIGERKKKSPDFIDMKLRYMMLKKFSAASRQQLVYKAFGEGILHINKNKNFHLGNALHHLGEAKSTMVSALDCLDAFTLDNYGFSVNSFLPQKGNRRNGNNASYGSTPVASNDRLKNPLRRTGYDLDELMGTVFSLLDKVYQANGLQTTSQPDGAEIQELHNISQGFTVTERSESPSEKVALSKFRGSIVDKISAQSIPHAMSVSVAIGAIPAEWSPRLEEPTIPEEHRVIDIISLIAKGANVKDVQAATGFSQSIVTRDIRKAYSISSASDWPSLIYWAIGKGLVAPQDSTKQLHQAGLFIEKSKIETALALKTLSGIRPVIINRYLSRLSDLEIDELKSLANGTTHKQRQVQEGIGKYGVDTRRGKVTRGLGAKNHAQAVGIGVRKGLLDLAKSRRNGNTSAEAYGEYIDILELVAQGALLKEVAKRKGIHRDTVAKRMNEIREVLGAKTTPHAVLTGYEEGWLALD